MYGLTDGMQLIADCFASLERIESFLLIEELNGKELNQQEETTGNENGDEKEKDEKNESDEKPFLKVQGYVILVINLAFFLRRCTPWALSSAEAQSFFSSRENPLNDISAGADSAPSLTSHSGFLWRTRRRQRYGQAATEMKRSLSQYSP